MRICRCLTVSREVLAAASHTGLSHTAYHRRSKNTHNTRIAVEGAISDDGTLAVVQIQARRESKVDAAGPQFRGHHQTAGSSQIVRALRIRIVELT